MTSCTASVVNIEPLIEDAGISVQVADRSISQYCTKRHLTLLNAYRINNCEDLSRWALVPEGGSSS